MFTYIYIYIYVYMFTMTICDASRARARGDSGVPAFLSNEVYATLEKHERPNHLSGEYRCDLSRHHL